MKKTKNIASIVELLLLFVILLFVIVTVTRTFVASRSQSLRAQRLTEAVILAEDIAESVRGLADRDEAADRLALLEVVEIVQEAAGLTGSEEESETDLEADPEKDLGGSRQETDRIRLSLLFANRDGRQDSFEAELVREKEESEAGIFVTDHVSIYETNGSDPLYELDTGWYAEAG